MKRFISFSGGVESTTMCVLYGADAKAIWADTGAEHKEMYDRIIFVENTIKTIHPNFEIIKVKGVVKIKGNIVDNLEDAVITKSFMPSGQRRFCTADFKIKPIDKFLQNEGECELMIGFNADEEGRTGNLEEMKNVTYTYPLIEDGYTRDNCEEILTKNNLHPNFPVYMVRGGCRMCFFKSIKEFKALYHLNPIEFWELVEFEEKMQGTREKYYAIRDGKPLRQLAKECQNEKLMFDEIETLYKSLKKETSCGAFCHR